MSRHAVATDVVAESFSSILDRLTRKIDAPEMQGEGDSAARAGRESGREFGRGSGLGSGRESGRGPGRLPLTPVAELKPGRGKVSPGIRNGTESVELSYESALRAHGRYRPAASSQMSKPSPGTDFTSIAAAKSVTAGSVSSRANDAGGDAYQKENGNGSAGKTNPAANSSDRARELPMGPALAAAHGSRSGRKPAVQDSKRESASGRDLASAAVARPEKTSARPGSAKAHAMKTGSVMATRAETAKTSQDAPIRKTTKSDRRARGRAVPGAHQAGSVKDVAGTAVREKQLAARGAIEVSGPAQLALVQEFKRNTVSVRLSEEESERLRVRAAESGMSVSSYMRSCVLEADQLRFQVKEALAEMRARVASGASVDQTRAAQTTGEMALLTAGSSTSSGETGGVFSRLVARSMTFLLGPWYPMRRSI